MGLDLDYFTCCQLLLFSIDIGDSIEFVMFLRASILQYKLLCKLDFTQEKTFSKEFHCNLLLELYYIHASSKTCVRGGGHGVSVDQLLLF